MLKLACSGGLCPCGCKTPILFETPRRRCPQLLLRPSRSWSCCARQRYDTPRRPLFLPPSSAVAFCNQSCLLKTCTNLLPHRITVTLYSPPTVTPWFAGVVSAVSAAGSFLGLAGDSDSDDDGTPAAAANRANPSYYSGDFRSNTTVTYPPFSAFTQCSSSSFPAISSFQAPAFCCGTHPPGQSSWAAISTRNGVILAGKETSLIVMLGILPVERLQRRA
jgi:hypothetical protein